MSLVENIYVGEFLHQMDDKNRLCIPAKWRPANNDTLSYLALPNPIGCITVYPPKMVERLENKVSEISLGDTKGQKILAKLFSQADTFNYDKQGRITLSEKLLAHANLNKSVTLVGSYVTFNIWEPKKYEEYIGSSLDNDNEISNLLKQLGL